MDSVEVVDGGGRRLILSDARFDGEVWTYQAELRIEAGTAVIAVWDPDAGIDRYFAGLATLWRGFAGERSWASIEGHVVLRATHDGSGLIRLVVVLARMWPGEWAMEATFEIGAGAHLERIADELAQLFAR